AEDLTIPALDGHVEAEHLRLRRIVQEELTGIEAKLSRQRVLDTARERRIIGDPLRGICWQLAGGTLECPLEQSPLAKRQEEGAWRAASEIVQKSFGRER